MSENYKIIFVLINHPLFGYIIEAHRIILLKNGQWSVEIKKIIDISSQFLNFEIFPQEQEILEMAQTTREENVFNHFNLLKEKKPTSNGSHFSDLNINKHLVPFVSKHTAAIIDKLIEYDMPVYYKNEEKGIIGEQPLGIELDAAEPRFSFQLTNESFTYHLTVYHNEKQLSLPDASLITQKPCFLRVENKLYYLPDDFDGQLLKPFLKNNTINVPKEKVNLYLQTFVSKIIKKYRVDVSGFTIKQSNPQMTPVISISKLHRKTPVIELAFSYDSEIFPAHSSQSFILKLNSTKDYVSFVKVFRNEDSEKEIIQKFSRLGFKSVQNGFFTCDYEETENPDVYCLLKEIARHSSTLKSMGFEFDVFYANKKYSFETPQIFTSLAANNDWFDLKINVKFQEFTFPFNKIIPNIIKGNNEFVLPDGTVAIIPEEWFSRYKDISVLAKQDEDSLKIHKSQLNLIQHIDESLSKQLSDKLKSLLNKNIPAQGIPEKLRAELREYQKKGFEWLHYMHECGLGGCLADDMGLGKTIQVLSYFLHLSQNGGSSNGHEQKTASTVNGQAELFKDSGDKRRPHTHLIVAPLSLIHNWQDEIAKFSPSLKTIQYTGPDRYRLYHNFAYADVILTSYGIVRNDADVMKHFDFHTIVLDESQFIKNPDSKSYDALITLNSKQRFVLTGTPLENSLTDIWTQMNFVNPGMLGSLKCFKDTYVIPVEKNNDPHVSERIKRIIGSFILRRTKSEVTPELPALTEKVCYCTMADEQKKLYETKKSEIRNYLIESAGSIQRNRRNMIVLSGLMKLRLIANHPKLSDASYSGNSGKFDEICAHIQKVVSEGHKTIVFSQFIKHLNVIREYLDENQISYEVLTGQTTQSDRQKNIKRFQKNKEIRLFLMTLKAGGVGLNLTEADYVFVLDPWWNPATENQAINRTHRIGQDKKVFAYKFISTETIEEKIMLLQKKKSDLFDTIINSASFGKLSEEELLDLFE
jgi:hypothetical protein